MSTVSDETKKENAVEFPYRVASPEFFFLLQRIDRLDEKLSEEIRAVRGEVHRLDEKLSGEIRAVDEKLSAEIRAVNEKLDSTRSWMIGLVVTVLVGMGGIIAAMIFA